MRTDRDGGAIHADVVVLAEGVNGLLGTRAGPAPDARSPTMSRSRSRKCTSCRGRRSRRASTCKGDEGVVIEAAGTISKGMTGMGFIYTNKESISVGIGCLVSDFAENGETPYGLLEAFKKHPSVAPLIEGSEVKEYAAHLIPEGGYKAIPQLFGDGWVLSATPAQLNNAIHREGSNLAMTSGRLAGEAIFQVKSRRDPMTKAQSVALQEDARRQLRHEGSEEIQGHAGAAAHPVAEFLPHLSAARLQGDGEFPARRRHAEDRKGKGHDPLVRQDARSLLGLFGDAFRLARAWR